MTRNNKMVLGVAAGVAALAVAGVYANKKGYLKNINTDNLKNKLGGLKDTAMKAFGGNSEGSSNVSSGNSMNSSSMPSESSTNGGATKRKSSSTSGMSSGNTGTINPATT